MQYYRETAQNPSMMGMPSQQYNPAMAMPTQQYNPMMNMTQQQLENMYPTTYNIVQPAVENVCDNLMANKGPMYTPTHEEISKMANDIYSNVESEVEAASKKERQFYGSGRFVLNDLVTILLLNSLIRRRRPFYGYPGFYGGFSPYGFGGYPYY